MISERPEICTTEKSELEAYAARAKQIFDDAVKSKMLLVLNLDEFTKSDPRQEDKRELDEIIIEYNMEIEKEKMENKAEERIHEMYDAEVKFVEYIRDERNREIVFACDYFELELKRDLNIQREADDLLLAQTEIENEKMQNKAEERMEEMKDEEERYLEYIRDEDDREILAACEDMEMKIC